jgi:RNA polymerase sigma-70 factor (ECF subfamily)
MDPNLDFQEIYRTYHPKLVRYFTGLIGEADAEDLAQESFVKIDRGLKGFRGDSSLSTWIYRIATNVARDRFRSAAFRQDSATEPILEESIFPGVVLELTPERDRSLEAVTIRKEMNT